MKVAPSKTSARRLGEDAGFLLVEILVSAAILLVVATGVLTALNANDRLAGNQQKRAIAANVAQAEIERVRSLPIEDVANLKGERLFEESGTTYTVTSTTKWVTDGTDEPECTTRSGGLDYMRLTTTVGWKGMQNARPIKLSTIVTPSSRSASSEKGSISVQISRADPELGAAGILVSLDGPESPAEVTNTNGCVVFPFVAAGAYEVSFRQAGWVDGDNVNAVKKSISVAGGTTTKLAFQYDLGGTTSAEFYTRRENALSAAGIPLPVTAYSDEPSSPQTLALYNGVQSSPPFLVPLGGTVSSWDARETGQLLFPSRSPYTVYAGRCTKNAPNTNVSNVTIDPGEYRNTGRVQLPSLNLVVYRGSAASLPMLGRSDFASDARVSFSDGCGGIDNGRRTGTVALAGRLKDPGFPYVVGVGSLCVQWYNGSRWRRYLRENFSNTDMTDTPARINVFMNNASGGSSTTAAGNYSDGTCGF